MKDKIDSLLTEMMVISNEVLKHIDMSDFPPIAELLSRKNAIINEVAILCEKNALNEEHKKNIDALILMDKKLLSRAELEIVLVESELKSFIKKKRVADLYEKQRKV